MYWLNEIRMWRQRGEDLVREVEGERLARRLRTRRPKRVAPLWSLISGRFAGQGLGTWADCA